MNIEIQTLRYVAIGSSVYRYATFQRDPVAFTLRDFEAVPNIQFNILEDNLRLRLPFRHKDRPKHYDCLCHFWRRWSGALNKFTQAIA
ncbi:hypothetical protein, partial [Heyndrickxia sporothermodurans]